RVLRVITKNIGNRFEHPHMEVVAILWHHQYIATLINANFICKLFEASCIRKIEDSIGRAAMTVSAGDYGQAQSGGKLDGAAVLTPRAVAIQLDCVQRRAMTLDKQIEQCFVMVCTDSFDVPQWMVQNEQCPNALIQHRQEIPESSFDGIRRVLSQ